MLSNKLINVYTHYNMQYYNVIETLIRVDFFGIKITSVQFYANQRHRENLSFLFE